MRSVCLALVLLASVSAAFLDLPPPEFPTSDELRRTLDFTSSAGDALVFNDYFDRPEVARELSKVDIDLIHPKSHSGYVRVDETHNSHMFLWYFPAKDVKETEAPTLLWLQGGPGGSSLFGLFGENGPVSVGPNLKPEARNVTWNRNYNMIYIDNPAGVGFSFTDAPGGYSTNEDQVAHNLYKTLEGFFTIFAHLQKTPFYVTGESYGGKYVPAISHKILTENKAGPKIHINLQGLAMGDGLVDPETQVLGLAPLAFAIGIFDHQQHDEMRRLSAQVVEFIQAQNWSAASAAFHLAIDGPPDYFTDFSGSYNYYDLRKSYLPAYGGDFGTYVNQSSIRAALHVGDHYFGLQSGAAGAALNNDIPKSVKHLLPDLLDNYKVLFYNGQFDFIVAPITTELMIPTIKWQGIEGWKHSSKTIWRLKQDESRVAGYVKQHKSLTQIVVRDAGHILPYDQPDRAFDMITRWVDDKLWTN